MHLTAKSYLALSFSVFVLLPGIANGAIITYDTHNRIEKVEGLEVDGTFYDGWSHWGVPINGSTAPSGLSNEDLNEAIDKIAELPAGLPGSELTVSLLYFGREDQSGLETADYMIVGMIERYANWSPGPWNLPEHLPTGKTRSGGAIDMAYMTFTEATSTGAVPEPASVIVWLGLVTLGLVGTARRRSRR